MFWKEYQKKNYAKIKESNAEHVWRGIKIKQCSLKKDVILLPSNKINDNEPLI